MILVLLCQHLLMRLQQSNKKRPMIMVLCHFVLLISTTAIIERKSFILEAL